MFSCFQAATKDGHTALGLAKQNNYTDVVSLLHLKLATISLQNATKIRILTQLNGRCVLDSLKELKLPHHMKKFIAD